MFIGVEDNDISRERAYNDEKLKVCHEYFLPLPPLIHVTSD